MGITGMLLTVQWGSGLHAACLTHNANQCQQPSTELPRGSLMLVMHPRCKDRRKEWNSLPYGKETLRQTCQALRQHRSIAFLVGKISTALFHTRETSWEPGSRYGKSIGVYPGPQIISRGVVAVLTSGLVPLQCTNANRIPNLQATMKTSSYLPRSALKSPQHTRSCMAVHRRSCSRR